MPNVKHVWSSVPWRVSVVLALAFVHQGVQLRKAHRETEPMREPVQQALQAKWQRAGCYRPLEVERQKLAREQPWHCSLILFADPLRQGGFHVAIP